MHKKTFNGETTKDRLREAAADRLYRFVMADGAIRGAVINGSRMTREMRLNHELGILETLVLGHAYLAVALMACHFKSADTISLRVDCSGPIKGLVVEGNAFGEVRGFLKNVPIPIDKPLDSFDAAPFFGEGELSVTRILQDARQPFTGTVALQHGSLAKDLAHYYQQSEQIPSAFNLSVAFDEGGAVTGAAGLFLQALPQADEPSRRRIEQILHTLPSLSQSESLREAPMDWVRTVFADYAPQRLGDYRVEFMCHCSQERIRRMFRLMGPADIADILENERFPLEVRCHYCNSLYEVEKKFVQRVQQQGVSAQS